MAFKMKKSPMQLFGNKELRREKKAAKLEQKAKFKRGEITRQEYKEAKKEIRKYKDY